MYQNLQNICLKNCSKIANHPLDVEYIRLLHDIHACNIEGHLWRGYILLDKTQQRLIKEIQAYRNNKRPVWFIFSGVGSQWFGLGTYTMILLNCYNLNSDVLNFNMQVNIY